MGDAMAVIERLREQFIAAFEAGEGPDPREYLIQLEGADQRELEALLDAYLDRAPRRRFRKPPRIHGHPCVWRAALQDGRSRHSRRRSSPTGRV